MRVLFCNIAWMKYYKGIYTGIDEPRGGGSYVEETGDAHEAFNFEAVHLTEEGTVYPEGDYCLGFVETKSTNKTSVNQLKIESIEGCAAMKSEAKVEDVLVIYCAKYPDTSVYESYVVGWYKHATVFRNYEAMDFPGEAGEHYIQNYNAIAKKEDCVLLPVGVRRRGNIWSVPRRKKGISYGFGQANVWFASGADENDNLKKYLGNMIDNINNYDGENWIDKYPEQ